MVNSPEILPGRSHGQRRLATHKELATTKHEHIQVCLQVECSGCYKLLLATYSVSGLANTYTTVKIKVMLFLCKNFENM